MNKHTYTVISLYKFFEIKKVFNFKNRLMKILKNIDAKGIVLLAPEGININISIATLQHKTVLKEFNKIFKINRGQHPILVKTYLAKRVSLETLCILNDLLNYTKNFSKEIKEDIIWPTLRRKIEKYGPFMTYNKERMKLILRGMV